jgi:hypothetical protein
MRKNFKKCKLFFLTANIRLKKSIYEKVLPCIFFLKYLKVSYSEVSETSKLMMVVPIFNENFGVNSKIRRYQFPPPQI